MVSIPHGLAVVLPRLNIGVCLLLTFGSCVKQIGQMNSKSKKANAQCNNATSNQLIRFVYLPQKNNPNMQKLIERGAAYAPIPQCLHK